MNNIDKLNLSLGLIKSARVSFGMLRSFLGKHKPMFHGINPVNQSGLLNQRNAVTAAQAINQGLIKNVEGSVGMGRASVANSAFKLPLQNIEGKPHISYRDLIRHANEPWKNHAYGGADFASSHSKFKYEGPISAYTKSQFLNTLPDTGAGKNWGTISFRESTPLKIYGDFGVMTTPSRVSGNLRKLNGGVAGTEIQAQPKMFLNSQGFPNSFELPQAGGKIYYHPNINNADFARQLITRYGRHNVIPYNKTTQRKLKYLGKNSDEFKNDFDLEKGNIGYKDLINLYPDHLQHKSNVKNYIDQLVL